MVGSARPTRSTGEPSRAGSRDRRGAVLCRNVPWQTSENSSSSAFGEYAKWTAPREVTRPFHHVVAMILRRYSSPSTPRVLSD